MTSVSKLIHATTLVIDAKGIVIRGASGSGKSYLALTLLRRARQADVPAGFVADDQTTLALGDDGAIVATCPKPIIGKIEVRPFGISDIAALSVPHCAVALVCDLLAPDQAIERVQQGNQTVLLNQQIAHLNLPMREAHANCSAVFAAIGLPCWY